MDLSAPAIHTNTIKAFFTNIASNAFMYKLQQKQTTNVVEAIWKGRRKKVKKNKDTNLHNTGPIVLTY